MNSVPKWTMPLLVPFSWAYCAGVFLRNNAFDRGWLTVERIGVPVIAIGNIVTGGVGKTPLVRYVAEYCRDKGLRVGVVSRGYKRRSSGVVEVSRGSGPVVSPEVGGDEAMQLALALPELIVVVGERRLDAAQRAIMIGAGVIIADDAYQHRYLGRNLNILVLDASQDLTREQFLPPGRLREPLSSVRRADVCVLSHLGPEEKPAWVAKAVEKAGIPIAGFRFRTLPPLDALDGTTALPTGKVLAFSGIGNHERFVETLRSSGIAVAADIRFPDHHEYSAGDFLRLGRAMVEAGCGSAMTTEKDIARIDRSNPATIDFLKKRKVSYIPVSVEFTQGLSVFHRKIDDCLNMFSEMRKGQ